MFKMFAPESREPVFPYHYFIPEIIIPRDCESFLNLVLLFQAEPCRYQISKCNTVHLYK